MDTQNQTDISLRTETGRFKYRVAGITIHQGKVLLVAEDRFDFWYFPGGHAQIFESSNETLKREIFEELGYTPIIERLLWTTESMYHFSTWNINHHDLTFYYLMKFNSDCPLYSVDSGIGEEKFSNEDTVLRYQWFELDKVKDLKVIPTFLKERLKNLPIHTEHLIVNDLSS